MEDSPVQNNPNNNQTQPITSLSSSISPSTGPIVPVYAPNNSPQYREPKKKAPIMMIILASVIMILLAAGGTYAFMIMSKKTTDQAKAPEKKQSELETIAESTAPAPTVTVTPQPSPTSPKSDLEELSDTPYVACRQPVEFAGTTAEERAELEKSINNLKCKYKLRWSSKTKTADYIVDGTKLYTVSIGDTPSQAMIHLKTNLMTISTYIHYSNTGPDLAYGNLYTLDKDKITVFAEGKKTNNFQTDTAAKSDGFSPDGKYILYGDGGFEGSSGHKIMSLADKSVLFNVNENSYAWFAVNWNKSQTCILNVNAGDMYGDRFEVIDLTAKKKTALSLAKLSEVGHANYQDLVYNFVKLESSIRWKKDSCEGYLSTGAAKEGVIVFTKTTVAAVDKAPDGDYEQSAVNSDFQQPVQVIVD